MGRIMAAQQNANDKLPNLFRQAVEKFQNWRRSLHQSEPLYDILKRVLWALQFATKSQTDCVLELWYNLMDLMRVTYDHQVREWTYEVLAEFSTMQHLIAIVAGRDGFYALQFEYGDATSDALVVSSGAETIVETMLVRLSLCICQKFPEHAETILLRYKVAKMISRMIDNKAISRELRKEVSRRYLKLVESVKAQPPPQHLRVSAIRNSHERACKKIQPMPVQGPTKVEHERSLNEMAYQSQYHQQATYQPMPTQNPAKERLERVLNEIISNKPRKSPYEAALMERARIAFEKQRSFEEGLEEVPEQRPEPVPQSTHWSARLYPVRHPESHIRAQQMQEAYLQQTIRGSYEFFRAQQLRAVMRVDEALPVQSIEESTEAGARESKETQTITAEVSPPPPNTEELTDILRDSDLVRPPPANNSHTELKTCGESEQPEMHSSFERIPPRKERLEAARTHAIALSSGYETDSSGPEMDLPSGESIPDEGVELTEFGEGRHRKREDLQSELSDTDSEPLSETLPLWMEDEGSDGVEFQLNSYELLEEIIFASQEEILAPLSESRLMKFYKVGVPLQSQDLGAETRHPPEQATQANPQEDDFQQSPTQIHEAIVPAKEALPLEEEMARVRSLRPIHVWQLPCEELVRLQMERDSLDLRLEESAC